MSDGLSNGLAIAGFALAVVSLTWQFWFTHRVDRARLRVTIAEMNLVAGRGVGVAAKVTPAVVMTVTNVGRRATVVQSLNLILGRKRHFRDRLPKRFRSTYDLMPFAGVDLDAISTQLPMRLEPGDEASVYILRSHVASALSDRPDKRVHAVAGSSTAGVQASGPIALSSKRPG